MSCLRGQRVSMVEERDVGHRGEVMVTGYNERGCARGWGVDNGHAGTGWHFRRVLSELQTSNHQVLCATHELAWTDADVCACIGECADNRFCSRLARMRTSVYVSLAHIRLLVFSL